MSGDRTPPERITIERGGPVGPYVRVEYVLASRLAEVERERDEAREERLKAVRERDVNDAAWQAIVGKYGAERDVLRARVEELEAFVAEEWDEARGHLIHALAADGWKLPDSCLGTADEALDRLTVAVLGERPRRRPVWSQEQGCRRCGDSRVITMKDGTGDEYPCPDCSLLSLRRERDALREEVERLTRERDDLSIRADERRVQINERDAVISRLRAVLGQRGKDAADAEDALSRIHEHLTDAILLLSNRYKPTLTESLSMRAARAENELRAAFEVSDPIVGEPEPKDGAS